MKYWLSGVLALCMAGSAAAQNFQLVYSPTLKLEIWIDNVKNKNASSWCARDVPLRIVSRESKDPDVLQAFLPRVGGLMSSECSSLRSLQWQMNDSAGNALAAGSAQKANNWEVEITPPPAPEAPAVPADETAAATPAPTPEELSPAADTTPWLQFSLINGCHFRTWWNDASQTSALFVPGKAGMKCTDDGWLHGQSTMTRSENGATKTTRVTFVSGFPVEGLKKSDDALRITTVNNERMVLRNDKSPQSWLILPWQPQSNSWSANGVIAVQMTPQEASDDDVLKARINEVRKSWGSYLNSDKQPVGLVQALSPQLKDPAAGAFRTLK
ncbi:hypothetical protein J2125_001957 [Erwinia toletana]|uniref:Uncharacterized protein n=1 Tax=Winslowiella toletana TaxID=92490 RepID=A0ABS4P839_9GAMM|nr:hypothetical protein [Winslowiella toletana]MBP2168765.1 hypothetical protein [Winslowiella toletana]